MNEPKLYFDSRATFSQRLNELKVTHYREIANCAIPEQLGFRLPLNKGMFFENLYFGNRS